MRASKVILIYRLVDNASQLESIHIGIMVPYTDLRASEDGEPGLALLEETALLGDLPLLPRRHAFKFAEHQHGTAPAHW